MVNRNTSPKTVPSEETARPHKSGYVALIGRPNVGKSTLLNRLLEFKLSIVTPKPQTTRHTILGIVQSDNYQIAFLDTPGMIRRPTHRLDYRMVMGVRQALDTADLLVLVCEPRMPGDIESRFLKQLATLQKPTLLALNKIDTITKPTLLPVMAEYYQRFPFRAIVPISALKSDGLDLFLDQIVDNLPLKGPLFPVDELTDRSERFMVSELIREKVYYLYREEIPYATTVDIEIFDEGSASHGGKDYISAVIYVERTTQRRILIGNAGDSLKEVGTQARIEIEKMLGRPVHLELWVKSHPRWRENASFLTEMGY